jgi:hypothetical protein
MVDGEEAKPKSSATQQHAAAESKDATDTAGRAIIVVNEQTPQGQQDHHPAEPPNYFSRLFAPENLPNIALVLVGLGAIAVAMGSLGRIDEQILEMRRQVDLTFGQLRATHEQITEMSKQTSALERSVRLTEHSVDVAVIAAQVTAISAEAAHKSADAALLNAQAVINAERPWIVITAKLTSDGIVVYGQIKGRTPAIIIRGWGEHIFVASPIDLPDEPPYSVGKEFDCELLQVPGDEPFTVFINPIANWKHTPRWDKMILMEDQLFYFGKLLYRDVIIDSNPIVHESRWCFQFIPGDSIVRTGKRSYNRYI